jgi:hypothetical protein
MGRFIINSTWEALRDIMPKNTMHHLPWYLGHVPRYSFILWLTSLGRLYTMDRLQAFHIINSVVCIIYGSHVETHNHLFFEGFFSASV